MARRFMALSDVAETLDVSASQAYALVRSGELPAIKVGGRGQSEAGRGIDARPADEPGDLGRLVSGEVDAPGPDGAEQTQLAETVDVREFPANRGPDFARPRRR